MKVLEVVSILAISQIVTASKRTGEYIVKQHFAEETVKDSGICKTHYWTERVSREDRPEKYEKLIYGSINCTEKIGPLSALILVYRWTETGWKNEYAPMHIDSICIPPWKTIFKPFFDYFDGKLNELTCTIPAGNYNMRDWSIEEGLHKFSDQLPFVKYKSIMTWQMPGIDGPITGMELIFETVNKEQAEHRAKKKSKT